MTHRRSRTLQRVADYLRPEAQIGLEGVDLVGPAAALGLMLAWIGMLFALAAALLGRRDLE